MNHYIYKVVDQETGEYYIGIRSCHCTPEEDTGYKGSGVRLRNKIRGRWSRYSKKILMLGDCREEVLGMEKLLITTERLQDPLCLNLAVGGRSGQAGIPKSEEHRQKISQALMGHLGIKTKGMTGKKHSEETKQKISRSLRTRGSRNQVT